MDVARIQAGMFFHLPQAVEDRKARKCMRFTARSIMEINDLMEKAEGKDSLQGFGRGPGEAPNASSAAGPWPKIFPPRKSSNSCFFCYLQQHTTARSSSREYARKAGKFRGIYFGLLGV